MERAEPYRDIRELTPELLLELTQSHKFQTIKGAFSHDIGVHSDVLITEKEIEIMGETLKGVVFFVSTGSMRSAVELARDKGVLATTQWL